MNITGTGPVGMFSRQAQSLLCASPFSKVKFDAMPTCGKRASRWILPLPAEPSQGLIPFVVPKFLLRFVDSSAFRALAVDSAGL